MPEVTVFLPVYAEYAVTVEISDEALENREFDEAMDAAYDELPSGVCAHCTGGMAFMRQKWSLELEANNAEVRHIQDENGETVYGDPDKPLGW